jgi:hypothetical protein
MGIHVHTPDENRKVGDNRLREPAWGVLPAWTQIASPQDDAGKRWGMQSRSDLRSPSRLEPFSMSHFSSGSMHFQEHTGRAWPEKARR